MIRAGITGGIGSGKSTVCRLFEILNVPVYYADDRAKWLMKNNAALRQEIIKAFGEESYDNGELNRSFLAKTIFSSEEKTKQMNQLVHPKVGEDFKEWCSTQQSIYVIEEAALMFESGAYKHLDVVITVNCPEEIRIQRVVNRDEHRTREDVQNIIQKQWSESQRISHADFQIDNSGNQLLIPQVLELDQQLKHIDHNGKL